MRAIYEYTLAVYKNWVKCTVASQVRLAFVKDSSRCTIVVLKEKLDSFIKRKAEQFLIFGNPTNLQLISRLTLKD